MYNATPKRRLLQQNVDNSAALRVFEPATRSLVCCGLGPCALVGVIDPSSSAHPATVGYEHLATLAYWQYRSARHIREPLIARGFPMSQRRSSEIKIAAISSTLDLPSAEGLVHKSSLSRDWQQSKACHRRRMSLSL